MTFNALLKKTEFIGTINPVRFGVSPMNPRMENIGTYRLTLIWIVNIPFVMPRKKCFRYQKDIDHIFLHWPVRPFMNPSPSHIRCQFFLLNSNFFWSESSWPQLLRSNSHPFCFTTIPQVTWPQRHGEPQNHIAACLAFHKSVEEPGMTLNKCEVNPMTWVLTTSMWYI